LEQKLQKLGVLDDATESGDGVDEPYGRAFCDKKSYRKV